MSVFRLFKASGISFMAALLLTTAFVDTSVRATDGVSGVQLVANADSSDEDTATVWIGTNEPVEIPVHQTELADGSFVASFDTSDVPAATMSGRSFRKLPRSKLSAADIEHWVSDPSPEAGDPGPQPGEASTTSSGQQRAACCSTPAPVCVQMDRSGDPTPTIHLRTCSTFANSYKKNGYYYFTVKNVSTATADDQTCSWNCDQIKAAGSYTWYSDARVVSWSPNTDVTVRNACYDVTTPSSFGSASVSETRTVCPDSMNPYQIGPKSSGAKWTGDACASCKRGFHYTAIGEWPSGVSNSFNVTGTISWT